MTFSRALVCAGWLALAAGPALRASEAGPHEIYQALNALRVDSSHVYYVKDLHIRRDAVRLTLVEGKLAFLAAYDGKLTGAVFTGHGHALMLPRDPVEKRQLARFLGAPLLDQGFSRAYFRFTDDTAADLERQLREAEAKSADEPGMATEWDPVIANLNSGHSLRILADWFSEHPRTYFYAGLLGETSGAFDVLVDDRRAEQVLLGQPHWVAGEQFYDVWASFPRADAGEFPPPPFEPLGYTIDTSIGVDRALEGTTTLTLKARAGSERLIFLELSRFLAVQTVEDADGHPLVFFQNEAVNRHEIAQRGNDSLVVVLPAAPRPNEELRLRFAYHGSVISDAGNGVFFVGARGSWYPHVVGTAQFAPFELTFRWPRRLQLVATGKKTEEHEEGETRTGRWRSEAPISVAGFNLGDYASETIDAGNFRVEVYANHQLEQAIAQRFRRTVMVPPEIASPRGTSRSPLSDLVSVPDVPPSPAAVLKELGQELVDAARFFERFNGPFPFDRLAVSQIPGTFGQGWPGLVYLSTFSFLTPASQRRAGLSERAQEHFTDIVPYHEVAHQWWGNVVGWDSYRDQWIEESIANYIALLFADTRKTPERALSTWLERYRKELTAKLPGQEGLGDDAGPLVLGYRLRSSRSPEGFDRVIYGKGTWVMHMLRVMLREPGSKNPDARFIRLLHALLESHRYRPLTTQDFERAVEQVMTPAMALEGGHSMEWFFDEWVRSSGIPRYAVEFTVRPQGTNFVVRGTLKQSGVPETFLATVPLYLTRPGSKPVLLGTVVTSGERTAFQFVSKIAPKRLLIDPQLTLLCATE